nr:MAG TPA: hypothetical protein [Caudoviricetes sp.]
MKKLNKLFLTALLSKCNEIMDVYYEEALKKAQFPFGVIPTLSINPLNYGYQCIFDIELYVDELSDFSVEDLCDKLKDGLDGYRYMDQYIGFYLMFENQYLTKQSEQDFTMRKVSFVARIF